MALRKDHRKIRKFFEDLKPGGRIMVFGRPILLWDGAPSAEDYYRSLGFSEVHSIDISDYQGATHIHDLNAPDIAEDLKGKYRAVVSGGTIEHIYDVKNALKAGCDLLEEGGIFYCNAPVNNWVDHGFWQISPTLKFDYFAHNNFDFGRSEAHFIVPDRDFTRVLPLYPGEGQLLNFIPARLLHTVEVIKTPSSTTDRVPLQSVYMKKHTGEFRGWRFRATAPYDIVGDQLTPAPLRRFGLDAKKMTRRPSNCFACPFRVEGLHPSLPPGRPFRSKALVLENGELLHWIVSSEELVGERDGSFAHIGGRILLTSSDGSDPRENGRAYEVAFPERFRGIQPYTGHEDLLAPA